MPPLPNFNVDLKTTEVNTAKQQLDKLLRRGDTEHVTLTGRRTQRDTNEWEWVVISTRYSGLPPQEDPE